VRDDTRVSSYPKSPILSPLQGRSVAGCAGPRRFGVFFGLYLGLISSCHYPAPAPGVVEPHDAPPPQATTTRAVHAASTEPAPNPVAAVDPDQWLFVERASRGAAGGWATASFITERNKLDIETRDVQQFAIDTSRIPIDWERLVVLSINGVNSELRRRDYAILHFELDDRQQWIVIEP